MGLEILVISRTRNAFIRFNGILVFPVCYEQVQELCIFLLPTEVKVKTHKIMIPTLTYVSVILDIGIDSLGALEQTSDRGKFKYFLISKESSQVITKPVGS
jgi:hypothetical protein